MEEAMDQKIRRYSAPEPTDWENCCIDSRPVQRISQLVYHQPCEGMRVLTLIDVSPFDILFQRKEVVMMGR